MNRLVAAKVVPASEFGGVPHQFIVNLDGSDFGPEGVERSETCSMGTAADPVEPPGLGKSCGGLDIAEATGGHYVGVIPEPSAGGAAWFGNKQWNEG